MRSAIKLNLFSICIAILTFGWVRGQEDNRDFKKYHETQTVLIGEDVLLKCPFSEPYNLCNFQLPDKTSCIIKKGQDVPNCQNHPKISFVTDDESVCSIRIKSVNSNYNGEYKCVGTFFKGDPPVPMEISQFVEVVVSHKPDIIFENAYGSVILVVGTPTNFTCTARGGRPMGKISWVLGDMDAKETLVNDAPLVISKDDKGLYDVAQSFWYMPKIADNGKRLFCVINATDNTGRSLYSNSDHVSFDIYYLNEPTSASLMPPIQEGGDFKVSFVFGAYPMPRNSDIVWKIWGADTSLNEFVAKDSQKITEFNEGKYYAHSLLRVGNNMYQIEFGMRNVTLADAQRSYSVSLSNRKKYSEDLFTTKTHSFDVKLKGESSSISYQERSDKILRIVLIVLFIFIAVALITIAVYAKLNKLLCFKEKGGRKPDEEGVQRPLNARNDSSILRN